MKKNQEVPICEKVTLTVDEAALYSNIGQNKIRELIKRPHCSFLLLCGNKYLIKRVEFEKFLTNSETI